MISFVFFAPFFFHSREYHLGFVTPPTDPPFRRRPAPPPLLSSPPLPSSPPAPRSPLRARSSSRAPAEAVKNPYAGVLSAADEKLVDMESHLGSASASAAAAAPPPSSRAPRASRPTGARASTTASGASTA